MVSIRSKNGNYIAEAAFVFPLTILSIVTVVLVAVFFFEQVFEQCKMNMLLREESGVMIGRSKSHNRVKCEAQYESVKQAFGVVVNGKKHVVMREKGVLKERGGYLLRSSSCGIDRSKYVRFCNLIEKRERDDE